jgi:hypothetical protein
MLDLGRLREVAVRESYATPRTRKASDAYGEQFRQFAWCYAIDALPRLPRPYLKQQGRQTSLGTWRHEIGDEVLTHFMAGVLRDLDARQGNGVHYAYVFETGSVGQRHVHAFLGNISRLEPRDIQEIFRKNGFGDTKVKLWNPDLHSGYYFKSLDKRSLGYDTASWEFSIVWNRNCKQRMQLRRRHLDRMLLSRSQAA